MMNKVLGYLLFDENLNASAGKLLKPLCATLCNSLRNHIGVTASCPHTFDHIE